MTPRASHGVVYADTVFRVDRGDVHRLTPLGTAELLRPGRLRLELHQLLIDGELIELNVPLELRVAFGAPDLDGAGALRSSETTNDHEPITNDGDAGGPHHHG